MKKALDQTVRDLKREVNKKVLKIPSIEQKTLDATSNEPWGPRGSLIAEIAHASCNFNDYRLIMSVLWRRIQDTGKNWRHVYKALSVLEYLAIYGTERVIDDIREHAYQISTLSDFLYTDSNGRDQGSNVRRKSQTLVALVNNKERLQEVRSKAQSNKEKVSRPPLSSSARYSDEHFDGGSKEDGLVRGRFLVVRNKDRHRSGGDICGRDSDEFGRRDDKCKPRSQSVDEYANNSFDDYDRRSTRSDGGRVDESLHDERIDAPQSYEVATNDSWSDVQNDKGATMASMQNASSPSGPKAASSPSLGSVAVESAQAHENEAVSFSEFDLRGSVSANPTVVSSGFELDIFGLSAADYTDSSAHAIPSEPDENPFGDSPFKAIPQENFQSETNTSASSAPQAPSVLVGAGGINLQSQSYDFGNTLGEPNYAPDVVSNGQISLANPNFYSSEFSAPNSSNDILHGILPRTDPVDSVSFKGTQPSDQSHFLSQNSSETGSENLQIGQINPFEQPELSNRLFGQPNPFDFQPFQPSPSQNLQGVPVPVSVSVSSQMISMDKQDLYYLQTSQSTSVQQSKAPFNHQSFQINPSQQQNLSSQAIPPSSTIDSLATRINNQNQSVLLAPQTSLFSSGPFQATHSTDVPVNGNLESAQLNPLQHPIASTARLPLGVPVAPHTFQSMASASFQEAQIAVKNIPVSSQQAVPSKIETIQSSFSPHSAKPDLITSSQGSVKPEPSNKKFEPKSAVWADTISRGIINLNISGPRTNPLADIGIDFDDINRKEKRNEVKSSQTPSPSSFAMGRAMGAGSGLGRAGVGASMGSAMGVSQPYMGMGIGAITGMMGPSLGMPQPGHGFPGAYNAINPRGGYGHHQPYGRGGYS